MENWQKRQLKVFLIVICLMLLACEEKGKPGNIVDRIALRALYPFEATNKEYPVSFPPLGVKEYHVPSSSGSTHIWVKDNNRPTTIVYYHGNGETIETLRRYLLSSLDTLGNWVVFDYPGLGLTTGSPNERSLTESGLLAFNLATVLFPDTDIYLWGRSLGTGVVMQVMKIKIENKEVLRNPKGIILTSPFTSTVEVMRDRFKSAKRLSQEFLDNHSYNSLAVAPTVFIPVLIHHGENDEVVPYKFGEKISKSLPEATLIKLQKLKHNDIFSTADIWSDVKEFLR